MRYDHTNPEHFQALCVDVYLAQTDSAENWAPVATELADKLRDDEPMMASLLEVVRKLLADEAPIDSLADFVHDIRDRVADRTVERDWRELTASDAEPDDDQTSRLPFCEGVRS